MIAAALASANAAHNMVWNLLTLCLATIAVRLSRVEIVANGRRLSTVAYPMRAKTFVRLSCRTI